MSALKSKFKALQLVIVISALNGGCDCNDADEGTIVQLNSKREDGGWNVRFWNNGILRKAYESDFRPLQGKERLTAKKKFENSSMYKYATI